MHQTNVLEYLEKTVTRVPDKLAFSNGEEGLTFAQVYHDSRAIGSYLASRGYYNEPVVVFMRKHPKCISGFYGCMYGGCYYVPIDEEMPRFRIELIFQNLKPRIMLCDSATAEIAKTFDFHGETMIYDEVVSTPINEAALADIRDKQLDTDPIYIVFTSGSTGIPKGVGASLGPVKDEGGLTLGRVTDLWISKDALDITALEITLGLAEELRSGRLRVSDWAVLPGEDGDAQVLIPRSEWDGGRTDAVRLKEKDDGG